MSTRKLDQIKNQIRQILAEFGPLSAYKVASMTNPPVSSTAVTIALNHLHDDAEVRHLPKQGWELVDQEAE